MEISKDYLFKIIGIERTKIQILEEENNNLKNKIKNKQEEKNTLQKTLKSKVEDV